MVGISHVATRRLVRDYLPEGLQAVLFTEMLSTRRIPSERLETARELKISREQGAFVPQLLGNEEEFIAKSMTKLSTLSPFGFDINMGCPVKHTLRHNWGVRLMGDISYAAQVVAWARKSSPVPLGVKLRAGTDAIDLRFLDDFTRALEDQGADWLTIHARPSAQKHSGPASWQTVGAIASCRGIPVIANGDIQTAAEALSVIRDFGADGAMIGRAITARPWLLAQIAWHLQQEDPQRWDFQFTQPPPMTLEEESREYFWALDRFIALLDEFYEDEDFKLKKLRFFIASSVPFFVFGHSFWKMAMKGQITLEVRDNIRSYGEKHAYPMESRAAL